MVNQADDTERKRTSSGGEELTGIAQNPFSFRRFPKRFQSRKFLLLPEVYEKALETRCNAVTEQKNNWMNYKRTNPEPEGVTKPDESQDGGASSSQENSENKNEDADTSNQHVSLSLHAKMQMNHEFQLWLQKTGKIKELQDLAKLTSVGGFFGGAQPGKFGGNIPGGGGSGGSQSSSGAPQSLGQSQNISGGSSLPTGGGGVSQGGMSQGTNIAQGSQGGQ